VANKSRQWRKEGRPPVRGTAGPGKRLAETAGGGSQRIDPGEVGPNLGDQHGERQKDEEDLGSSDLEGRLSEA